MTQFIRVVVLVIACTYSSWLYAQDFKFALMPSATQATEGNQVAVDLVVANAKSSPLASPAPARLTATLTAAGRTWPVTLQADGGPTPDVSGGGFSVTRYTFAVPSGATGQAVIDVRSDLGSEVRGVIDLAPASAVAPSSEPWRGEATASASSFAWSNRVYRDRLQPFEPIYFIYGPDKPAAKFQLSFKYRILGSDQPASPSSNDPVHSFQMSYTQRSLWNVSANASPFYDTSYMPALFYEWLRPQRRADNETSLVGIDVGYRHESNGKGDSPDKRSLNNIFIRPVFTVGLTNDWHLAVIPEVFHYVQSLERNPDIEHYRGNAALKTVLAHDDGPSLVYYGYAGSGLHHITTQLDLSLPVASRALDFKAFFLVQYFNGYGDTLLNYTTHVATVRAGLQFVR
jgi:outer membrane phospholipase A